MSEVIVRQMKEKEIFAVAKIHHLALSDDFLPSLGFNFLKNGYYKSTLRNPYGKVFVASIDNNIVGFVNIALDSRAYVKYEVKKNLRLLVQSFLKLLFKNPSCIIEGLVITKTKGYNDLEAGEIMFIAVDKFYQKQGIGKMLVNEANKYFSKQGIRKAFTKTLVSNNHVIKMYEKYGAEKVAEINIMNKKYIYLQWNTTRMNISKIN